MSQELLIVDLDGPPGLPRAPQTHQEIVFQGAPRYHGSPPDRGTPTTSRQLLQSGQKAIPPDDFGPRAVDPPLDRE
ncbi:MAG: hypothetical protein R3B70_29575 [Polyangiaceae bacterium]